MGWFGRGERGFVLGIRQTAIPLGGALAALSLPAIAIAGGLEAALLTLAGFTLVAAIVGAIWLRDPPPSEPPPGFFAPPPTRDPRIWRLGIGSGLFVMAQAAVIGFVVLFLHDDHGMSLGAAAAVLAAIQVTSRRRAHRDRAAVGPPRPAHRRRCAARASPAPASSRSRRSPTTRRSRSSSRCIVLGGAAMSSWNGLSFTVAAEIAGRSKAGTAMSLQNTLVSDPRRRRRRRSSAALAGATSFSTAYLVIALAPVLGWWVLRPLEDDEEERAEARRRAPRRVPCGVMSATFDTSDVQSGLEGVVAFATEIAEPDKAGGALRYRGVDIEDLVGQVPYEKVWGLLVDGSLRARACRPPSRGR